MVKEFCRISFQTIIFIGGYFSCSNPIMLSTNKSLNLPTKINSNILFVIYFDKLSNNTSDNKVQFPFKNYLEKYQSTKLVFITENFSTNYFLKMFAFNLKPRVYIYRSDRAIPDNVFENKNIRNFQQKSFLIKTDIPAYVGKDCLWEFCRFLRTFAEVYNASIEFVTYRAKNISADISSFSLKYSNFKNLKYYDYVSSNLMVPNKPDHNKFYYYFIPFSTEFWILHCFTIIFISITKSIMENFQSKNYKFILNFLQIYQMTLLQSFDIKTIKSFRFKIMFILFSFYSMIVALFYCGKLGSFFVKSADFSKFSIICESELLSELLFVYPKGLRNINLIQMDAENYWRKLFSFDLSFGYCMNDKEWDRLNEFQKLFKLNAFKLIYPDPIGKIPNSIFVRKGSIFKESLEELASSKFTYGLDKYWANYFGRSLYLKSILKISNHRFEFSSLNISDIKATLIVCGFGFTISCFLFFGEYYIERSKFIKKISISKKF